MVHQGLTPADVVRRSAELAHQLAGTARLHNEPEEAARFELLAAEGEARAARLAELTLTSRSPARPPADAATARR